MSRAAVKNAKKRANGKKKEDGKEEGDGEAGVSKSVRPPDGAAVQQQDGAAVQQTDGGADDPAKRKRALEKKLRQVAELKEKLQKEGGNLVLTPEQKQKLDGEAALIAELSKLSC